MWNAGLDESQAGIKTVRGNINNLRYADDTTLMAGSEEELKSLSMGSSEKLAWNPTSKNSDHGIWSHDFMANRRRKSRSSNRFYLLGLQNHCGHSKISWWNFDCSHEIKRCLLLRRRTKPNLDSIFKSRATTLLTKVRIVKAMVFPVVRYGYESWIIKKTEHWRTDAFELWCWRKLLRVQWTARRSNQSILKEINPEYSLKGLMLKLQYCSHLMWRADSLVKTLTLKKTDSKRRSGQKRKR